MNADRYCERCGTPGKKSRDDGDTMFCPRCGIWLEDEDELITEPSAEAPTDPAPAPMTEEEAHAAIVDDYCGRMKWRKSDDIPDPFTSYGCLCTLPKDHEGPHAFDRPGSSFYGKP